VGRFSGHNRWVSDYYFDPRIARAYDAEIEGEAVVVDDIPFYVGLAQQAAANGHGVLELGCGTGRVTIPIAQAGVEVVGLDNSAAMLDVAGAKAIEAAVTNVRWVEGEMESFELAQRFGLVIIPFRSFQLLLTDEQQLSCLNLVWRHLQPGGRLALNLMNPELVEKVRRSFPPQGRGLDSLVRFSARTQRNLKSRYIARYEMQGLLARAGFAVEALFGWFDGRPFSGESREIVWLAKKAEQSKLET
jgi:SAM-dependent methyltransferase